MTKERLFIKSDDLCSDRFLHKGEQFIKEMNFNIKRNTPTPIKRTKMQVKQSPSSKE